MFYQTRLPALILYLRLNPILLWNQEYIPRYMKSVITN